MSKSPGGYSTFYEDSNMSIHGEGHYNALFLLWSVGFSCIHLFHFNGFLSAVWLRGGWTFMSPSLLTVFSFLLQPWKRCGVVGHRQLHLLFILFWVSFPSSKFLWELIFSPANLFFLSLYRKSFFWNATDPFQDSIVFPQYAFEMRSNTAWIKWKGFEKNERAL